VGQAGWLGHMNAASLVATVTADLWSLLSDPSITGSAPRPAAWMHPTSTLLLHSAQDLNFLLSGIESMLGDFIGTEQQATPPAHAPPLRAVAAAAIQSAMGKGQLCMKQCSLCHLCRMWLGHSSKHQCGASPTLGGTLFTAIACLGYGCCSYCYGPCAHSMQLAS
jgi:hypothetical protein